MTELVIATRSKDKLREITELLAAVPQIRPLDLNQAGIPPDPEEDSIEVFDTFEENALAKAHYFALRSGKPVLADDSGICVDALEGAPGVRSKRFANRPDLTGVDLDRANNERLLELLAPLENSMRGAHYACALALVTPDGREAIFHGTVEGMIIRAPNGSGGFGYDPLFLIPQLGATFGELSAAEKNGISHRARAFAAASETLKQLASEPVHPAEYGRPSR